jgi:uncharacterized membrane protein
MGLTVIALGWLAFRLGGPTYAAAALALAALLLILLYAGGRRQRQGIAIARWQAPAAAVLAALAVLATPHLGKRGTP